MSERCEAKCLIQMFTERGWNFCGQKHRSEKMTAVAALIHASALVIDRTFPAQLRISTKLRSFTNIIESACGPLTL